MKIAGCQKESLGQACSTNSILRKILTDANGVCPDVEVEVEVELVPELGTMVTVVEPEVGVMVIVVEEAGVIVILEPELEFMVIVPKVELLV